MWTLFLLLIVSLTNVDSKLSCKNMEGKDVDWFVNILSFLSNITPNKFLFSGSLLLKPLLVLILRKEGALRTLIQHKQGGNGALCSLIVPIQQLEPPSISSTKPIRWTNSNLWELFRTAIYENLLELRCFRRDFTWSRCYFSSEHHVYHSLQRR